MSLVKCLKFNHSFSLPKQSHRACFRFSRTLFALNIYENIKRQATAYRKFARSSRTKGKRSCSASSSLSSSLSSSSIPAPRSLPLPPSRRAFSSRKVSAGRKWLSEHGSRERIEIHRESRFPSLFPSAENTATRFDPRSCRLAPALTYAGSRLSPTRRSALLPRHIRLRVRRVRRPLI